MASVSGPSILIVEDEALVRMHGVGTLEDAGFTVFEAADADEAIQILKQHPEIRLLFSDIDMPGSMDGLALARLVHETWPDVRLLLTSGHHRVAEERIPDAGRFLSKPWHEHVVVRHVKELLIH